MVDHHITRGPYEFYVMAEADSFHKIASISPSTRAMGAVDNIKILESVHYQDLRNVAKNMEWAYATSDS